jgi:hypothetical protein
MQRASTSKYHLVKQNPLFHSHSYQKREETTHSEGTTVPVVSDLLLCCACQYYFNNNQRGMSIGSSHPGYLLLHFVTVSRHNPIQSQNIVSEYCNLKLRVVYYVMPIWVYVAYLVDRFLRYRCCGGGSITSDVARSQGENERWSIGTGNEGVRSSIALGTHDERNSDKVWIITFRMIIVTMSSLHE